MVAEPRTPHSNPLNVYTGRDSVVDYFDPDCQPPVPLVELPERLNPLREDGVRIYAKMMSCLPANNVKSLPALNMLEKGVTPKTKRIIEYSSGSTVVSLAMVARAVHGIDDVHAYVSNKTSEAKLRMMRFFGLNVTLFGGASQPNHIDPRGGIWRAHNMAQESDEILNPNQYENHANPEAHMRWTGPQLLKQIPEMNVFCAGMGTSGSMAGTGASIKLGKPSVHVVGVCTVPGDRVPGPRAAALLCPIFPWKETVDSLEEIGSYDSYRQSMNLSREGLICGPSSGFNLQGLLNFLEKRKKAGTLKDLAGEDGEIHCVFLCCDLPYQYLDDYFTKLGEENFHPVQNQNLQNVDLHRYDDNWELNPADAFEKLYTDNGYDSGIDSASDSDTPSKEVEVPFFREKTMQLQPNAMVVDLRSPSDFDRWHLPGSINLPLLSAKCGAPSPFVDSKVLEEQWNEIETMFSPKGTPYSAVLLAGLKDRVVGLVCSDGDTAKVASSVLRAKGIEASSIAGGICKAEPMFRRAGRS